jgi:hypothetical protein
MFHVPSAGALPIERALLLRVARNVDRHAASIVKLIRPLGRSIDARLMLRLQFCQELFAFLRIWMLHPKNSVRALSRS